MSHKGYYIDKPTVFNHCGKDFYRYEMYGFYKPPYKIDEVVGYHSVQECPNCKKNRATLELSFDEHLKKFPNCCDNHKRLLKIKEFDIKFYDDSSSLIADKILFTKGHVINHIGEEDWREEIFDYIEYVIDSFGMHPKDHGNPYQLGNYFKCTKNVIQNLKRSENAELSLDEFTNRKNTILDKLRWHSMSKEKWDNHINMLLKTYEKWYFAFPFDIPYFSHLKDKFQQVTPIYQDLKKYNKYLKKEIKTEHTKESLLNLLYNITLEIITSINTKRLHDKGEIKTVQELNEIDKVLFMEKRELEIKALKEDSVNTSRSYINKLSEWFEGEQKFIEQLKKWIPEETQSKKTSTSNSSRPNRTDLAYFVYYADLSKELQILNPFPSDKAWDEIGKRFEKNAKNIQKIYNQIANNQEERLKANRKKTIEYVINNLLSDYPKAKEKAEIELKQANLN